jgi:hypothetical protein
MAVSSPDVRVLERAASNGAATLAAWGTDALLLPPLGVNCVLALLAALLASSFRALGVASDPLVALNPPIVTVRDIHALQQRAQAAGAAFGAVRLPRVFIHCHAELLQRTWGVWLFTGLLLRGGTFHRHACGFNAGSSLFYVNPQVVIITTVDRQWPLLFFDRMALLYGLHVPRLAARLMAIEPCRAAAMALPSAADLSTVVAGATATGAQQRKRTRSGGKTHRGKRGKRGKHAEI